MRAGVQALRAGVLLDRRPGLGHGLRALPGPRASGPWSWLDTGHHAPGTNIEFIVAAAAPARTPRLLRLQLPLLRRRRSPRRRRRPVPALSDPRTRSSAGRRAPHESSGVGVHARPVPQHRGEDPRPDPIGAERPGGMLAQALLVDLSSPCGSTTRGDVLGANEVLMDAFYSDVRPVLAELARVHGSRPRSAWPRMPRQRLRGADRGRARSVGIAGSAGAPDVSSAIPSAVEALLGRSTPARRGPAATRTTPAGTPRPRAPTTDPVTGQRGRADVGEGLRWRPRPRSTETGSPSCGWTGCGRWSDVYAGDRARGRDGGGVRLLPARPGRGRALDRHRHARLRRGGPTSTTSTPTPASPFATAR